MRYATLFSSLLLSTQLIQADPVDLKELNGDWHLRVMDGYDVRKVRAILEFDPDNMKIGGFDACNRIGGTLVKTKEGKYTSRLMSTRMACRGKSFIFVSKRLHEMIKQGFIITKEKRYGIDGITLKSTDHDLFFKRMGR